MKHAIMFIGAMFTLGGAGNALASMPHVHANTITAHNIAAIQHTATQTAFNAFTGASGATLDTVARHQMNVTHARENPATTYGRAPMYGTASVYGEYNDDGSAGRSGGDHYNSDAAITNAWLAWQHMDINAKLNDAERLGSDTDVIMGGISGGQSKLAGGLSKWGLYTGYITSTQENSDISIDEHGGLFGIYNGNTFGNLGLYLTLNGGVLNNSADTAFGTDEYSNFWAGGAVQANYNIALDRTFTLQPSLHIGYTWIKSEDYTSASGDVLTNDAFGFTEITPALRAIKHIGNGWFGALDVKYVALIANGGDITVNDIATDTPDADNFTEIGISLEKSVANFNFTANIARQDGARDGWIGGLNIKYIF